MSEESPHFYVVIRPDGVTHYLDGMPLTDAEAIDARHIYGTPEDDTRPEEDW
jgi:hypothetical protein